MSLLGIIPESTLPSEISRRRVDSTYYPFAGGQPIYFNKRIPRVWESLFGIGHVHEYPFQAVRYEDILSM